MVGPTSSALQTAKTPRSASSAIARAPGAGGRVPSQTGELRARVAVDADVGAHQPHRHQRVGDRRRDDVGAQLQRQRDRPHAVPPEPVGEPAQERLCVVGGERQQVVVHHREHPRRPPVVQRRDLGGQAVARPPRDAGRCRVVGGVPARSASAPARRVVAATQQ